MEHAGQPHQGDQRQLVEKEIRDHGKTPSYKCRNEGILPGFQTMGISRRLEVHDLLLLCTDNNVDDDNLEAQKKALDEIANFADRICEKIPLKGDNQKLELAGNAKAELNESHSTELCGRAYHLLIESRQR